MRYVPPPSPFFAQSLHSMRDSFGLVFVSDWFERVGGRSGVGGI